MVRYAVPLLVIVAALVATVWLPFVNRPSLWLDLPSVMTWTAGWVVLITVALAVLEFRGRRGNDDDDEAPEGDDR